MTATGDADRVSTLPEELLGHILSFLDMKHSVQTCILSKSWRFGWRSVTSLNFDMNLWKEFFDFSLWPYPEYLRQSKGSIQLFCNGENSCGFNDEKLMSFEESKRFIRFVDRALYLSSALHIFSFNGLYSDSIAPYQVNKWITSAVSQHVEELHLKRINLLPSLSLGQVKTLKLSEVDLLHNDKELLFHLPVVENLILHDCTCSRSENLVICAPQVKYLSMETIAGVPAIKISAPNLISLKLKGELHAVFFLENFSSLVTAKLEADLRQSDCIIKQIEKLQHLKEILKGISLSNAKSLIVSTQCFPKKFWPEMVPDIWKQSEYEVKFHNVKYLKLTNWDKKTKGDIGAVVKLLESFSKLETIAFDKTLTKEVMNNLDLFFVFLPKISPELVLQIFNQESRKTHNVKYLKFSNLHMRVECDISGLAKLLKSFQILDILSSDKTWTKEQMEKRLQQKALLVANETKRQSQRNNRFREAEVRRQHNLAATRKVQAYIPNSRCSNKGHQ